MIYNIILPIKKIILIKNYWYKRKIFINKIFKDVINKYLAKSLISPENVSFFANGSIINPNLSVEKQMNNLDKDNKTMKVILNYLINKSLK